MCSIEDILEMHSNTDYTYDYKEFSRYGMHRGRFNNNLLCALGDRFGIDVTHIKRNSYNGYVSIDLMQYGLVRLCVSDNNLLVRLDLENIKYTRLKCYTMVYVVDMLHYSKLLQIYEMVDW